MGGPRDPKNKHTHKQKKTLQDFTSKRSVDFISKPENEFLSRRNPTDQNRADFAFKRPRSFSVAHQMTGLA